MSAWLCVCRSVCLFALKRSTQTASQRASGCVCVFCLIVCFSVCLAVCLKVPRKRQANVPRHLKELQDILIRSAWGCEGPNLYMRVCVCVCVCECECSTRAAKHGLDVYSVIFSLCLCARTYHRRSLVSALEMESKGVSRGRVELCQCEMQMRSAR